MCNLGDVVEDEVESIEFGRVAIQTFGQVVKTKIREAEKSKIINEFRPDEGKIISATVKKVTRDNIFLEYKVRVKILKVKQLSFVKICYLAKTSAQVTVFVVCFMQSNQNQKAHKFS